jgi:hypothetical protein
MTERQLLLIDPADLEEFGRRWRELSRRVHTGTTLPDDPIEGDGASGLAWLQKNLVKVRPGVTEVPIHFQRMHSPCIMLPPFELLKDPVPPLPYVFPQFYLDQTAATGPGSLPFYLKRIADYTLKHCGG